ncbi:50S ribosomal protein L3 N(5)-glutamine methyltransferase [Marinagarivorans algicola]|uniref:50S ribosomal protein L3 N(5)-glutamine methyltransferase n=1 Tax=Marinagarivorans algicola TaxID=1513270 RepID=UPI0006B5D6C3|nr:50S ribosomal protein L3 N(5)-glutamine methyltransferase [Marinagarivorans algicola]
MQKDTLLSRLAQAKTELFTLQDWLRFSAKLLAEADLFYGHGTDNAWDEAVQLVLWQAGIPWGKHEQVIAAKLIESERSALCEALTKRITERMPLPYITGQAYFAELPFEVSQDTLIPRSPFAELIENGFQPWLTQAPLSVLDLCTGSGCIGIAAALLFEEAEVDLSDISAPALVIAQRNIDRYQLGERVSAIESDLFAGLQGKRYDLIMSNPPYVDEGDLSTMPAEFQHEPALALGSGSDGLDFTRRLLHEARNYLTDEGVLIVEVGNSWNALENAFAEVPFTWIEFEHGGHGVFMLTAADLDMMGE